MKLLIAAARVEGLDDEYRDEMERLILERRRKGAQCEKAQALEEVAAAVVARNKRLNERKPGMVASDDVAKYESELKANDIKAMESRLAQIRSQIEDLIADIEDKPQGMTREATADRILNRFKDDRRTRAQG